jgi:hypothetical protein
MGTPWPEGLPPPTPDEVWEEEQARLHDEPRELDQADKDDMMEFMMSGNMSRREQRKMKRRHAERMLAREEEKQRQLDPYTALQQELSSMPPSHRDEYMRMFGMLAGGGIPTPGNPMMGPGPMGPGMDPRSMMNGVPMMGPANRMGGGGSRMGGSPRMMGPGRSGRNPGPPGFLQGDDDQWPDE